MRDDDDDDDDDDDELLFWCSVSLIFNIECYQ